MEVKSLCISSGPRVYVMRCSSQLKDGKVKDLILGGWQLWRVLKTRPNKFLCLSWHFSQPGSWESSNEESATDVVTSTGIYEVFFFKKLAFASLYAVMEILRSNLKKWSWRTCASAADHGSMWWDDISAEKLQGERTVHLRGGWQLENAQLDGAAWLANRINNDWSPVGERSAELFL